MPNNVDNLVDKAPRPLDRCRLTHLYNLIHRKSGGRRSAQSHLRLESLLSDAVEIDRNPVRRNAHDLKTIRNRRLHSIGAVALRKVREIDACMKITALCSNEERTGAAHANRHSIDIRGQLVTVRRLFHCHWNSICPLDCGVLIVHHIEPEYNGNYECHNFREQIVLHKTPKPSHHFFLQLRINSKIDEPELYVNAGVSTCVS